MLRPHGSNWGFSRVRRRFRRGKGRAGLWAARSTTIAGCLALALGCAGAPQIPVRAVPAAPLSPPRETARLPSCGGSGPDALVLTLSRIPAESDLRSAICDWFIDEPWRVHFLSVGTELPRAVRPSAGELHVTILLASESTAQLNVTAPPHEAGAAPARWLEKIALSSGLDDIGTEVVAQTLHSTAQASHSRAFRPSVIAAAPPAAALAAPLAPVALTPDATTAASPVVEAARLAPPVAASVATSAAAAPLGARPAPPVLPGAPVDQDRLPADLAYPPSALGVHTALGYQLYARGGEPVTHGPSLRVELDWLSRTVVLSSFVRGALFTSMPARSTNVAIELDGMGLGAGLAASLPWKHLLARLALGSNIDLVGISVDVNENEALRSRGDGRARPRMFLTSETGIAVRLGPIELGVEGLLRWQTSSSHYDVLEGGQPRTLVRAWRLQPGAALELAYAW